MNWRSYTKRVLQYGIAKIFNTIRTQKTFLLSLKEPKFTFLWQCCAVMIWIRKVWTSWRLIKAQRLLHITISEQWMLRKGSTKTFFSTQAYRYQTQLYHDTDQIRRYQEEEGEPCQFNRTLPDKISRMQRFCWAIAHAGIFQWKAGSLYRIQREKGCWLWTNRCNDGNCKTR